MPAGGALAEQSDERSPALTRDQRAQVHRDRVREQPEQHRVHVVGARELPAAEGERRRERHGGAWADEWPGRAVVPEGEREGAVPEAVRGGAVRGGRRAEIVHGVQSCRRGGGLNGTFFEQHFPSSALTLCSHWQGQHVRTRESMYVEGRRQNNLEHPGSPHSQLYVLSEGGSPSFRRM